MVERKSIALICRNIETEPGQKLRTILCGAVVHQPQVSPHQELGVVIRLEGEGLAPVKKVHLHVLEIGQRFAKWNL